MTLHSPKIYHNSHWELSLFKECFYPSKIEFTDIDMCVERKGHFLIVETKYPNVDIPNGQKYMYEAMNNLKCFTILFVWGEVNKPECFELWGENGEKTKKNCKLITLKNIIRAWYDRASAGKETIIIPPENYDTDCGYCNDAKTCEKVK